jgi:hypothetical protein
LADGTGNPDFLPELAGGEAVALPERPAEVRSVDPGCGSGGANVDRFRVVSDFVTCLQQPNWCPPRRGRTTRQQRRKISHDFLKMRIVPSFEQESGNLPQRSFVAHRRPACLRAVRD